MDRRLLVLGIATIASTSIVEAKKSSKQPNVILLMADDMGWGDTGFNGNRVIQTPHMDALSKDGVIFDRFYAGCSVSSPTRSSVLTGRNPYRTGIFNANAGIMRCEEVALAEILSDAGYATGHFGKWHLGSLTDQEQDANRGRVGNSKEVNLPSQHGYSESFVTESKVPTYDPMVSPPGMKKGFWDYLKEGDAREAYGTGYWRHDGTKESENLEGDDSRVIMDRVLPFIDKSIANREPFLSVVWFHAPHLPCVAGPEQQAMYSDYPIDKRNYYGCITALDEQVGRLVAHLKKQGVYDNTIIYFCSDNGPEGDDTAPGVTGGLQGRKRSLHEGGLRVPAFMVWGDKIKGGERVSTPLFTSDYLPTVVDILDLKMPENRVADGESMLPIIEGKSDQRTRPMFFAFKDQYAVIDNQYKLYYQGGKFSLYDIVSDREERENIIANHPDLKVKYEKIGEEYLKSIETSFRGEEYNFDDKLSQSWESPKTYVVKKKSNAK